MEPVCVLLVEDDPDDLQAMRGGLEADGLAVLCARSGQEGITLFQSHYQELDVVVLDLSLGDMSGFEVCRCVKRYPPLAGRMPVIILSGEPRLEVKRRALLVEQADAFVSKPFDPGLLSAQVQALARIFRRHSELFEQSREDQLTSLQNRRGLEEVLQQEQQTARRRLGCLVIDVDNFKQVNDDHGHLIGDMVLRLVVQRLKAGLRRQDILSRYGGDEFVALLPEADIRMAREVAERLCKNVSASPLSVPGIAPLKVQISVGVSTLDTGARSPAELVQAADQALLHAKRAGKNRVTHLVPIDAEGEARAC